MFGFLQKINKDGSLRAGRNQGHLGPIQNVSSSVPVRLCCCKELVRALPQGGCETGQAPVRALRRCPAYCGIVLVRLLLLLQQSPFDPRCTQALEFDFRVFIVWGLKPLLLLQEFGGSCRLPWNSPSPHLLNLRQSHLEGSGEGKKAPHISVPFL